MDIKQEYWELNDGRTLSIFLNKETNLFVVDVIREDDQGGNEIVRRDLSKVDTSYPEVS